MQKNVRRSSLETITTESTGGLLIILNYLQVKFVSSDQILQLLLVRMNISNPYYLYNTNVIRSSLGTIIITLTRGFIMILIYLQVKFVSSNQILWLLFVHINISNLYNLYKKNVMRSSLGTIITASTRGLLMILNYFQV